jgi:hypothetical protein
MKDILSEPEPNRLKFHGRNELASPEMEEREFDLNLSEEDEEKRHESSKPFTLINPIQMKIEQKQKKSKHPHE